MSWQPLGKFVLVKLHTRGSNLLLNDEVNYNGLADVLAIGPEAADVNVGDVVLLNGPAGLIAHKELGEHVALVAGPLVLARRIEEES